MFTVPLLNQKSIALLPFDNLSADPEREYFSDGMTEEIINALSKINGLKVTARTSSFPFKGLKENVRIIGNQLGVATVIEGSIHKSGDRVRIAIQLIKTDKGFHIWSERFDQTLKDIFELQDEISLLVADRIRENFGQMEIYSSIRQLADGIAAAVAGFIAFQATDGSLLNYPRLGWVVVSLMAMSMGLMHVVDRYVGWSQYRPAHEH